MNQPATPGKSRGHGFGTLPVFLTAMSTILGAILFLRFGYAVGHAGLLGSLGIIVLGHAVTIPTALALAEIATNRKVEGGGEYFIISRSFGTMIGGVIGISLYISQAISVAFYMIAFAQAFTPLGGAFESLLGLPFDSRVVSLPATLGLLALVYYRGANVGVRALYAVAAVLGISLILFFLGEPTDGFDPDAAGLFSTVDNPDPFFYVFAICFPAFTGMTAGVGLSGDLENPRVSIPKGTIAATLSGMVVYVFIVLKLTFSASPEMLSGDQLVMSRIALWGPIIPIGLACATLSSAIGSVLVAPRTLQALGEDGTIRVANASRWLAAGVGSVNEPRNSTLVTGVVAILIVALGNVDFVARLISMFFMVTYGSLCAISFLEHFAARPSYRPSFKSRWYVSLFGAVICLLMMFQMDPLYAVTALALMTLLYWLIARGRDEDDLASMFEGVMTQATRYMQVRLQRRKQRLASSEWRPSVIMVDDRTFDRRSPLLFMKWLCHRYGFGTYLHFIRGHLTEDSHLESMRIESKLARLARQQRSSVYMDTIVSPSMTSALAQSLQVPGVSGLSNNTIMFEFSRHDPPEVVREVVDSCAFAASTRKTLLVLRHGDVQFGERRSIHIWLTWNDSQNANLMILLSYIVLGHADWADAEVRVLAALPSSQVEEQKEEFRKLAAEHRLPISEKNIRYLSVEDEAGFRRLVARLSAEADLAVVGFDLEGLQDRGTEVFTNHPSLNDVLFVHSPHEIDIE
jgi:amino acid transporter